MDKTKVFDMSDIPALVKVGVDAYSGKLKQQFSQEDSMDTLREALVRANGGSTTLDYRKIRDGECKGVFTLVETILKKTVFAGLVGDEFFNALVEYKNMAEGDLNVFNIKDSNMFVISEVADGTQGVRRQRLGGTSQVNIPTKMHMVKTYEELNRVLSGAVDFNEYISQVANSFREKILNDIYTLWSGATAADLGGTTYYPAAGSYNGDALLDIVTHVESEAGGKSATIIGTKKALRMIKDDIQSIETKRDMYEKGYVGSFYGTPVVAIPQRHKTNTNEFQFEDKVIHIIAGDGKPIKFVYEGQSIMLAKDPQDNADFTQEYVYGEKYGMALITAGTDMGIGRYEMV